MAGVLRSWAVPKGISMDPADKRLAVHVPDHSLSYIDFEGTLAEGSYGAGEVRVWDNGDYETDTDAAKQFEKGKIVFRFFGLKVRGEFSLVRMHDRKNWLLIKAKDHFADPDWVLETVLTPRPALKRARKEKR